MAASSSLLSMMSSLIVSSSASATAVLSHSSVASESSIRLAAPVCPSLATLLRSNKSVVRRFPVLAMASSRGSVTKLDNLYQQVEESIAEAQEVCVADETSGECRVAWETVEELAAEVAHRRSRAKSTSDPLEKFCKESPEADECRVYED